MTQPNEDTRMIDRARMIATIETAPADATLVVGDFHDQALVVSAVPGAGGAQALIQIARAILGTVQDLLIDEEDAAATDEAGEEAAELRGHIESALGLLPDMQDDDEQDE